MTEEQTEEIIELLQDIRRLLAMQLAALAEQKGIIGKVETEDGVAYGGVLSLKMESDG